MVVLRGWPILLVMVVILMVMVMELMLLALLVEPNLVSPRPPVYLPSRSSMPVEVELSKFGQLQND